MQKALIVLTLFCSTIADAGSKASSSPPPTEQQTPPPSAPSQTVPAPPETPQTAKPEMPPMTPLAPAPLPSSNEMTSSYESAFVRMLVTLLGLVFLVFATFWILRRLGKGKFKMGGGRTINVLERKALSPKSMLFIVEIGNKKVLISESQVEVRALTTYEELPESET
jgi:flagellar biogenesis protein FliO